MATYDHKQVLADYAAGRITPEMAVGHSLQHIALLYESQTTTRTTLTERLNSLQAAVDRLTTFMDRVLRAQQKRAAAKAPKPGQS
ncbi:MAG: hypothetical protein R3C14_49840 [Caldilineaceae bacterium]